MIYENKILKKAEVTDNSLSFNLNDVCKMHGLEILKSNAPAFDEQIKSNAIEILEHFSTCTDILLFIQSAITHSFEDLKYTLYPPYTTSNLDCEYILKKLANIGLVEDFFYSSLSKAYRITLNLHYDINNILCIGLYSLLEEIADNIVLNGYVKLPDGNIVAADAVCRINYKIYLFNFEIATGLEKEVASHSEQLRRLSDKILQSYNVDTCNFEQYFIVSSHCKTLLPLQDRIVSVSDLLEIVSDLKS